jgi:hypothetical protein
MDDKIARFEKMTAELREERAKRIKLEEAFATLEQYRKKPEPTPEGI